MNKRQLLTQMMKDPSGFVDTPFVAELSLLIAQEERGLQESVDDLVTAADLDAEVDVVDPEDRSEQLRAGLKAVINGDVPGMWVAHTADVERPSEAAEYADLDADEWTEQRAEWAERWRDQGLEGTDEELAEAHTRARFDVGLEEFEELVVEWVEQREKAALRELLAGPVEDAQDRIDAVTATLQEE